MVAVILLPGWYPLSPTVLQCMDLEERPDKCGPFLHAPSYNLVFVPMHVILVFLADFNFNNLSEPGDRRAKTFV